MTLIDCALAKDRPAHSGVLGRDALTLSGMSSRVPASTGSTETTESEEAHTQPVSLGELTWLPLARRSCSHGVTTDTLIRLSRGAARSSDNLPSLTVPQLTVGGCAFTIVDSSS